MNPLSYFEDIGAWPKGEVSVWTYVTGFVLSVLLTLTAYVVATHSHLGQVSLFIAVILLALIQFIVQVICFLHLGYKGSLDRVITLGFSLLIVLILTSGSLWIMFTLNARMMPSMQQMEQYMIDQEGI
jgi:cytochrome o ubiquinol oxidase operon protein cyoD